MNKISFWFAFAVLLSFLGGFCFGGGDSYDGAVTLVVCLIAIIRCEYVIKKAVEKIGGRLNAN